MGGTGPAGGRKPGGSGPGGAAGSGGTGAGGVGRVDAVVDGIEADQLTVQTANEQREIKAEPGTFVADLGDAAGVDIQTQSECGGRPSGTCQVSQQPGRIGSVGQARGTGRAACGKWDTEYSRGGGASDGPCLLA